MTFKAYISFDLRFDRSVTEKDVSCQKICVKLCQRCLGSMLNYTALDQYNMSKTEQ